MVAQVFHFYAGAVDKHGGETIPVAVKSANVIFEDADIEKAAAAAPYSVFDNAGQDCCARSRIFVQKSVYDRFLDLLVDATGGVRVGDPADEATEMGPLVSAAHREAVASFVDGEPTFRGDMPDGPGYEESVANMNGYRFFHLRGPDGNVYAMVEGSTALRR